MTDLERYGMDYEHRVKLETVEQYNKLAEFVRDQGVEEFSLTEENCAEYPYAFVNYGLHGCMTNHDNYPAITFDEWAERMGVSNMQVDLSGLNSLL